MKYTGRLLAIASVALCSTVATARAAEPTTEHTTVAECAKVTVPIIARLLGTDSLLGAYKKCLSQAGDFPDARNVSPFIDTAAKNAGLSDYRAGYFRLAGSLVNLEHSVKEYERNVDAYVQTINKINQELKQ